jgi:hypothetical protein
MSAFLKKFTSKGIWRQVNICLRPLPMTPYSPPLTHFIRVYSILREGSGGGEGAGGRANQGEG